jgi:hypothetical protein
MLKEINCSIFHEKTVKFHKGLNIVLGDNVASNSIGKSTFLMILDFIFGGKSYIDKNADVVSNISEHEFNYCFEFDGEKYYFKRATENNQTVFRCDNEYNIIDSIEIDKYCNMLKDHYKIGLEDISFRGIVSLHSRVWQKQNFDVKKPLHEVGTQSSQVVINKLIKLFDFYSRIKKLEGEIKDLNESQNAIRKAEKFNHIPKINKTTYKKNIREIEQINIEMEKAALGISHTVTDIINSINNELAEQLRYYKRQKSAQESKLKRIRRDLSSNETVSVKQFQKLTEYFPNVNLEKLKNVERFHDSITNILREELTNAETEVINKIKYFQEKITETEEQLANLVSNKPISKEVMQPLIELSSVLYQKRSENYAYDKKQSVTDELKSTKENLSLVKTGILIDLCNIINQKIEEYNQIVHEDGRRSPKLVLNETNYSFGVEDNTGTGEAFVNLILFDLAIFSLTQLPIIIHDSMLFKNIENNSIEKIIDIYNTFDSQIFIAIDETEKYSDETKKIINSKKVLELSSSKLLFIKDWRKQDD